LTIWEERYSGVSYITCRLHNLLPALLSSRNSVKIAEVTIWVKEYSASIYITCWLHNLLLAFLSSRYSVKIAEVDYQG
jgi:hypothetical protein